MRRKIVSGIPDLSADQTRSILQGTAQLYEMQKVQISTQMEKFERYALEVCLHVPAGLIVEEVSRISLFSRARNAFAEYHKLIGKHFKCCHKTQMCPVCLWQASSPDEDANCSESAEEQLDTELDQLRREIAAVSFLFCPVKPLNS